MGEKNFQILIYILLGLIWYFKEILPQKKKNRIEYKVKLLYDYNSEIRNVFQNFETEQKNIKLNHPVFKNYTLPYKGDGIINNQVDIFGIPVYVFYKYQAEDFKLDLLKRIKRIESTKNGKREIKELIKKHNL